MNFRPGRAALDSSSLAERVNWSTLLGGGGGGGGGSARGRMTPVVRVNLDSLTRSSWHICRVYYSY